MEKDRSASEGPRIDGLNIHDYKLREYMCVFDRKVDIPNRLRTLTIGLQLYLKYGLSRDQFIEFHKNRQFIVKATMVSIITLLIFVELLVLYKLSLWTGRELNYGIGTYIGAAFTAWFIFYTIRTISKTIRANFIHINTALSSSRCLKRMQLSSVDDHSFFQDLAERVKEGDFDSISVDKKSTGVGSVEPDYGSALLKELATNSHTIKSERDDDNMLGNELIFGETISHRENDTASFTTFRHELLQISTRKNRFNGLPMSVVIDFFNIICCPACSDEVPQLSEIDFIRFLKVAFLGEEMEAKIKFHKNRIMITREIFHQFMSKSIHYLNLPQTGQSEEYISLLCDHFEGFEKEKTANNFRTEDNKRLDKLRNDYKTELQFLQFIQTAVKQ
ncbi:hypothetical protein FEM33_03230 [Dyadobacter flavalbus]|uniref:Uncharacterized protein n=1 Tax=Dyadobacter flavalbus TaxID=2579942 RepID=A0A5M8R4T1_9BACT|nr:hypothetical protein [Dyadobacter flavalbus]KAA6441152.1 hypothetical protein FEM33_03230 [Dyadobacter flavalbus]